MILMIPQRKPTTYTLPLKAYYLPPTTHDFVLLVVARGLGITATEITADCTERAGVYM
jgi:hypothetical protein